MRATKNTLAKTSEYKSWYGMLQRCKITTGWVFDRYKGRGISVCERWNLFDNFLADMGPKPSPSYQIDRIDNDKGYYPENCRWATRLQQMQNTSWNSNIEYDGRVLCKAAWAKEVGTSAQQFHYWYEVKQMPMAEIFKRFAHKRKPKNEAMLKLLERANSKSGGKKGKIDPTTPEAIEIALAWAKGEVNMTEVAYALGKTTSSTTYAYIFLARALKHHLSN